MCSDSIFWVLNRDFSTFALSGSYVLNQGVGIEHNLIGWIVAKRVAQFLGKNG